MNPRPANDATITLRLPSALRDQLTALADRDKRAVSDYIRVALEQHVDATK